ncbi:ADP-ribosyltransferase domain-containing protein [Providencia huaxiensis]|uniref:ADP-ribosyltransferase domain-containing protein n=1 Tax=Providencia huaxiensis TaxID=2027290 RepID=UPI0032DBD6D5
MAINSNISVKNITTPNLKQQLISQKNSLVSNINNITSTMKANKTEMEALTKSIKLNTSFLKELKSISDQHGKDSQVRLKNGHFKLGHGSNVLKNIFSSGRYQTERTAAATLLNVTAKSVTAADSTNLLKKLKEKDGSTLSSLTNNNENIQQQVANLRKELAPIETQLNTIKTQEADSEKAAEQLKNKRKQFSSIYQSNAGCKAINTEARYIFGNGKQGGSLSGSKVIAEYEREHGSDIFSKGNSHIKFELKYNSDNLKELVKTAAKHWYSPSSTTTSTYRGQGMTSDGLNTLINNFNADKKSDNKTVYQLGQFFSTSNKKDIAQTFANQSNDEVKVMFLVKGNSGSGIIPQAGLSFINNESEVLYSPLANFSVNNIVINSKEKIYKIELTEVKPQKDAQLLPY